MNAVLVPFQWYAVLLAISACLAPWIKILCPNMPDKGAFIVRPVGLLATVYPSWFLSSAFDVRYSTVGLWTTTLLAGAVGWAIVWRRGSIDRAWLKTLLAVEVTSIVAFALYAWWRGYAPQILNTEKPMDMAFLASAAHTQTMPPPDPWLAGESINYYYLGYVLHGAVARMSGVVPSVGFNLALAATFSMTVVAVFGTGFALVRAWASVRRAIVGGALAVAFLVFAGNLFAANEFLRHPAETIDADWWSGAGWDASRIVVDEIPTADIDGEPSGFPAIEPVQTINEFPAFSFALGDLHPHLLALPFTVVALYLAFSASTLSASQTPLDRQYLARIALTGAMVGSLYMLNSWDFPTYLLILAAAIWFGSPRLGRRTRIAGLAAAATAAVIFWVPFFFQFTPPVGGGANNLPSAVREIPVIPALFSSLGTMQWEHTSIQEFFTVFGVPYVFALWYLWNGVRSPSSAPGNAVRTPTMTRWASVYAAGFFGFGIVLGAPVVILCGVPLILVAVQSPLRRGVHGPATVLYVVAFALILGTEFFYIQDIFGNRMNTLFKVYYQAWTLFGIATAVAIVALWRDAGISGGLARRWVRPALAAVTAIALAAVLIYPTIAATDYSPAFQPRTWRGLDGIAFVGETSKSKLDALRWISAHAGPDDVVLEAAGCSYRPWGEVPTSRVSAFTGVPAVIGWVGHERQWHLGDEAMWQEIQRREALVDDLYGLNAESLRDEFRISLIFVGSFERDGSAACDAAGPYESVRDPNFLGPGWSIAFQAGDTVVYQRSDAMT